MSEEAGTRVDKCCFDLMRYQCVGSMSNAICTYLGHVHKGIFSDKQVDIVANTYPGCMRIVDG